MTLADSTAPGRAAPPEGLRLVPTAYDGAVVRALEEEVQQVYLERYGGHDETPMAADQFAPPRGRFFVGYLGPAAVAMGGWRLRADPATAGLPGERPAEIKRMFVRAPLRGRGLARLVLTELEVTARDAGVDWLVLETGDRQPEAIGLYRSAGYAEIDAFGLYAQECGSVYLGRRL